jgi:hypothetical protein
MANQFDAKMIELALPVNWVESCLVSKPVTSMVELPLCSGTFHKCPIQRAPIERANWFRKWLTMVDQLTLISVQLHRTGLALRSYGKAPNLVPAI